MSAIDRLPPALRNRGAVVSMANQLDRTRAEASRLRAEKRKPVGLVKVAIPTLGASFLGGYADAAMPDAMPIGNVKPSMAAGLIGGTAAYMMENEMGLFAAVGLISPAAYAAGVKAAGYELAILETTSEEDSGDTA